MAEENDTGEKTEEPTGRRKTQARGEGQVAKSVDLSQVLGITAAFVALQYIAPMMWRDIITLTKASLTSRYATEELTVVALRSNFISLIALILPEIMLLMVIAALFGAGSTALQTNFLWSNKLLKPKFKHLNPISGIKRIFSIYNSVNLLKSILKFAIIGPIAYFAFFDLFPELMGSMKLPVAEMLPFTADATAQIFWKIIPLLLILAIIDFAWQRYNTHKQMKMTKVEVKEEKKSVEGDEKTKMRIRGMALSRARQRMMESVPTADVVVTNPTHFSVALKYEIGPGKAPKVVAKGKGHIALKIREIARANGVPVVERKPLARALFKSVEIGQTIPYELFAAVAELLAYVYKMRGRNPFQKSGNRV